MAYVVREDVGTTPRRSLSGHSRLKVWERSGGICVICGHPIDGVRDRWIVEHIRALELGGADEFDNMGPAHEACGRVKTQDDHAAAAQAKRRKIRHLGAEAVTHPLPGSRSSKLKRKVDGTVVRRDDSRLNSHETYGQSSGERDLRSRSAYQSVDAAESPTRQCLASAQLADVDDGDTMISIANSKAAAQKGLPINPFGETSNLAELLPNVPAHLAFIFEKAPEPSAEAEAHYDTFRRSFLQELKPQTIIEAIWTKDVLTYTWEAHQLRVYRDHILKQAEVEAVADLIEPSLRDADPMGLRAFEEPSANAQAVAWQTGKAGEQAARVDAILNERGLTADSVRAHAFYKRLPTIDALNQMIQTAEQRRDGFLRELDRKRSSYATKLRAVTDDIIDIDAERVS